MEPLTEAQERQLRDNHQLFRSNPTLRFQFTPVAYIRLKGGRLIFTELDDEGRLYGVIDFGYPCFGSMFLNELRESARRLRIRRVKEFSQDKTIGDLLAIAERDGVAWIP